MTVLTSKEVLERTGISRATLNNYIGTGLIPRPEVLPPSADHGSAPRIGYFPEGTVERIAEIQRLKSQGWSIARIAAHFGSGGSDSVPAQPARDEAGAAGEEPGPPRARSESGRGDPVLPLSTPLAPRRPTPPRLTNVAVVVSTLQDAGELWLQLPAAEYFELVNDVWSALDRIFRRLGGRHGRHPGEGMVCHFVPAAAGASYLWSALSAAHQVREAMRDISSRWQSRKDWDFELRMNTGVDEGLEWLGELRLVDPPELTVVGGAAEHAAQLSRIARGGAIWMSRDLVGKLSAQERDRLVFGVPRAGRGPAGRRVLSSFARLQDLASLQPHTPSVPPALADLAITELLELAPGPAGSTAPGAGGA